MQLTEGQIIKKVEVDGKQVVIRMPKMDDVDGLMEYINSLVDEDIKIDLKTKVLRDEEERYVNDIIKSMKNGKRYSLCVEHDGRIVAHAHVEKKFVHPTRSSHVSTIGIAISKDFRYKGLGIILLNLLFEHAKKEMKSEIVKLHVFSDNKPAISLYTKLGFSEVGRIKNGIKYGNNKYADDILMIKELV